MFAKFYDAFMADVDYALLYDFYHAHKPKENPIVIDAGCGTGHFLLELIKHNEQAMGIDKDEEMLAVALDKLREAHVYAPLFVHDLKDPLRLKADVITSFFDVINYFKGTKGLFRNIYHALNDGGIFLCDCFQEDVLIDFDGYTESGNDPISYRWHIECNQKRFIHMVTFDGESEKIIQYVHPIDTLKKQLTDIGFHVDVELGIDPRKWYIIAKK